MSGLTVREMIRDIHKETLLPSELSPDRAAELLMMLSSLISNVAEEIREADAIYAAVLLGYLDSESKANRAKIRAEISPEFKRKQEARDVMMLVTELSRSLKYFLRVKSEEMRLSGSQK